MEKLKSKVSIQTTMVVAFALITLGVIATTMIITFRYTVREVRGVSIDYMTRLVSQVNADIERYITYMEDVSEVVAKNPTAQRWLSEGSEMSTIDALVLEDSLIRQMSDIMTIRSDITNIGLFSAEGRAVFDQRGKTLNPYSDYRQSDWYTQALERKGGTYVSTSHVQNVVAGRYDWVVSISRAVTLGSGEVVGVLLVDLNYSLIKDLCEGADMDDRGYLFLADREGNLIYHPQQQLIYSNIKQEAAGQVLGKNTQAIVETPEGTKLYISGYSEVTGWTVISAVYQDSILQNQSQMFTFYVLIFFSFFGIALLLSIGISAAISGPIRRLAASMQKVEKTGRLETGLAIQSPRDVAQLSESFNTMLERLRQLMSQRDKDQAQKRESELKALQAQINPHFLYNTLDSIIWMAENDESEQVVEMTAALAHLFRSSISESRDMVPLSIEAANVESYLTIQEMRYKEKLRFRLDIAPGVQNYPLPKLLLQPLVENAIYHGIKPRSEGGCVVVKAWRETGRMVIEVSDDGVGMDPQQVQGLFTPKLRKEAGGIGVYNVNERIKLIYGDAYGLVYSSEPGKGTQVRVVLPESWQQE